MKVFQTIYRMQYDLKQLDFCVLIPCYDNIEGLVVALQSINYNFQACLAVVVDDGSQQPLQAKEIEAAVDTGLHIQLLPLTHNRGITAALNTGLQWIVQHTTATYIARLDCSDVCHPQRFYWQVAFLQRHPNIGLLGTWCRFLEPETGLGYNYTTPVHHTAIINAMQLRNVFIHPTVMFQTKWVKEGIFYPTDYPHAEDYAFCWHLLQVTQGAILPEYAVTCAISRSGISFQNRQTQLNSRKKVLQVFGKKGWINKLGVIKINLLIMMPNELLLRLKGLINKINS